MIPYYRMNVIIVLLINDVLGTCSPGQVFDRQLETCIITKNFTTVPCPDNYYKHPNDTCIPCGHDVSLCTAGRRCGNGSYGHDGCELCPYGSTSPSIARTLDDCYIPKIRQCPENHFGFNGTCRMCPKGMGSYQNRAVKVSDCKKSCKPGFFGVTPFCTMCPRNTTSLPPKNIYESNCLCKGACGKSISAIRSLSHEKDNLYKKVVIGHSVFLLILLIIFSALLVHRKREFLKEYGLQVSEMAVQDNFTVYFSENKRFNEPLSHTTTRSESYERVSAISEFIKRVGSNLSMSSVYGTLMGGSSSIRKITSQHSEHSIYETYRKYSHKKRVDTPEGSSINIIQKRTFKPKASISQVTIIISSETPGNSEDAGLIHHDALELSPSHLQVPSIKISDPTVPLRQSVDSRAELKANKSFTASSCHETVRSEREPSLESLPKLEKRNSLVDILVKKKIKSCPMTIDSISQSEGSFAISPKVCEPKSEGQLQKLDGEK